MILISEYGHLAIKLLAKPAALPGENHLPGLNSHTHLILSLQ
jgi:hypothetical protein